MNWLKLVPAWCWLSLALLVIAGGQQIRISSAQADTAKAEQDLADYRLEVAERDRRALAAARTEEQRRQRTVNEVKKNAREQLELANVNAAAAEFAADGLRGEIERLRSGRSATCNTIATQQRKAGESAVVVLGGLLEESDRMAGSLAEALERSRIAGLSCEAVYNALTK